MLFVLRCISEKDFEAVKGKVKQKYKVWLKNFIILFSNTYFSNDGMRWVWRGRIGKCEPNSEKLGVQYGPTAAGRRSVLHPQFRRMRFALSMCPSQTHRIYIVIDKLKPTTPSLNSFSLWTKILNNMYIFQSKFEYILSFNSQNYFHVLFSASNFPLVRIQGPEQQEKIGNIFSRINQLS